MTRKSKFRLPYPKYTPARLAVVMLLFSSAIAQLFLHLPTLWVSLGILTALNGRRIFEAVQWRRAGGRSAARQRRKYQGLASWLEVLRHLSIHAARRSARQTRPQTRSRRLPGHQSGVLIGRTRFLRHRLFGRFEDTYLILGPPRCGKSGYLNSAIWDAPGAVLATSTRTDQWRDTFTQRSTKGPVWVINPSGDGGIPSTLPWSTLAGCETAEGANTAASYLMNAAPQDPDGKDKYWTQYGYDLLRLTMHAAAIDGANILDVREWIASLSTEPILILSSNEYATENWANELFALIVDKKNTTELGSIQSTALSALSWLADPAMAEAACALREDWFDAEDFILDGGTVYLIGADKPHSSLAPYFAAFAGHLFETAKKVAASSPGGRLDPPLTLALDEAANICPVPLPAWTSVSGGYGITLFAAAQSKSQLHARWGDKGGQAIWDHMTNTLVFGGIKSADVLEEISKVCGERDTWHASRSNTGDRTRQPAQQRVLPIERIHNLPEGTALWMPRNHRPVIAHLTHVWDRPGYAPASSHDLLAQSTPVITQQQAISYDQQQVLFDITAPDPAAITATPVPAAIAAAPESELTVRNRNES